MKKILSILVALLLVPSLAWAVIFRVNKQDQMLVTKLHITQYDRQGKLNPDFKSEYEFTYDDDTDELLKVIWTRWIKGTVHKEVLQREGDELKFSYYVDGKLQTKHTREYEFDARNSEIRLCKITDEQDTRWGVEKEVTILQYTHYFNSGMNRKIMKLRDCGPVYNYIRDIKYGEKDDLHEETVGVWNLCFGYDNDYNKWGFRNSVNYLISNDNNMYRVVGYKEEPYFMLKQNVVTLNTLDLARLSTTRGDIKPQYSDIENPTNINILPLAYQNHNSYLCMDKFIETVTPWYIFKSKNLPLKDKKTFDYDINNKGQLLKLTISPFEMMPYSTVVEFEYECDLRGWEPLEEE